MTSLNPAFRIGDQIGEVLRRHLGLGRAGRPPARDRAARPRRHPGARAARRRVPAPALRRHAAARDDRDGARLRSEDPDRRRADDGARRDDPGGDSRPAPRHPGAARHRDRPDHAQPRRRRGHRRPRDRHVRRPEGRGGAGARLFARPQHPYTIGLLGAIPRPGAADEQGRLREIPGRVPSLAELPAACAFARAARGPTTAPAPSCRSCARSRPEHLVACFHPGENGAAP